MNFCYNNNKPKYEEEVQLCYMYTATFIVLIKSVYADIAKDFKTKFCSNYKVETPLPRGKSKKVIVLVKCELGRKL